MLPDGWAEATARSVLAVWSKRFKGSRSGVPPVASELVRELVRSVSTQPVPGPLLSSAAEELGRLHAQQGRSAADLVDDVLALRTLVLDRVPGDDEGLVYRVSHRLGGAIEIAIRRSVTTFLTSVEQLGASAPSQLMTRDPLSGALSRAVFQEALTHELDSSERHGAPSLLIVDVGGISTLHERSGHLAGDLALLRMVDLLRSGSRRSDVIGRLGPERFGMLLPRSPADVALLVARRILARATNRHETLDPDDVLSITIGVAHHGRVRSAADLVIAASSALQRARAFDDGARHRLGVSTDGVAEPV